MTTLTAAEATIQTDTTLAPLLRATNVVKHFAAPTPLWGKVAPPVQAVHHVSLAIYPGEVVGLVGESGCGKSTLGRCLLQLIRPTSGHVWFEGKDLTTLNEKQLRPLRQGMQMVFQNPYSSLNPRMSIGETLAEPFLIHQKALRLSTKEIFPKVSALLNKVGLPTSAADRYPHEFSGGQRQRIGIARAIALNPSFIVADEPVSALDVSVQAQILNLLKDLQAETNLSLLFVAHNLAVVKYLSHRVAVMYLGQIVELASVDDLFHRAAHPYTHALLAAVPDPTKRGIAPSLLEGDPPSPSSPPSGCRFHPRCAWATDRCRTEAPVLRTLLSNSDNASPSSILLPNEKRPLVACHEAEKVLAAGGKYA
ncbi:MAG: ABC transporter ATP-binding protein [Vampirovibrionales bacterium]|nr:ABC transporter ATP-binding protein [Vampirovibrionales bacterium]